MPYDDDEQDEPTGPAPEPSEEDEELLEEIRENFTHASDAWREIREERQTDVRYLLGDPWSGEDKKARADAGRSCINHDELNQYCNQAINSARQNKRGIKLDPAGDGASEKSAEFRQNLIRQIEYKSKAQSVYLSAYRDEIEGGYGFCRISRRYVRPDSDDQEIVIRRIPNPDSVLYDPDCQEPDWADAEFCFVLEPLSKAKFKRKYPHARVVDFSADDMRVAKDWIQDKQVLTAEYWKVETVPTRKKTPGGRAIEKKTLTQYITNGIEILERNEQPGEEICIIPFIGLERYYDDGGGAKRKLSSLTRLARDPQMSLAYLCSQEMEEAGLSPKVSWIGYTGQFETDAEAWATAHKIPHSTLQVDPVTDSSNGQILPLPTRVPFTPNFQAYEVAKDSCRRSIQAAMGTNSLPTAAQRQNEKSGIALEKIQDEQSLGTMHFSDGFDYAIARAGRVIESWIDITYDTERDLGLRKPDDSHQLVRVNTPAPYLDAKTQQPVHYPIGDGGDHDVTISVGPSSQSQRDAASDFLDTLISELPKLPVAPPQAAKLLALAIQMKALGPKGDEMADIVSPSNPGQGQQAAQALAHAQQAAQAMQLQIQELTAELQKNAVEKAGKIVDNEYRLSIEKMKIEASLAVAEIQTKAQNLSERSEFIEDLWRKAQEQSGDAAAQGAAQQHEAAMQAQDHGHEAGMAQMDQIQQLGMAQSAQAHAAGMQSQAQAADAAQAQQSEAA